jgi:hypothetical protein
VNAAPTSHSPSGEGHLTTRVHDPLPHFLGGAILGTFAIAFCFVTDGVALATYKYVATDSSSPEAWPTGAVIGFGVFAVIISVLMGRWLFGLRRWIGLDHDPEDTETIRHKRRSFVRGACFSYLPLTPFVWAAVVAIAGTSS